MTIPDLRKLAGKRYRTQLSEEAGGRAGQKPSSKDDIWLIQIPCRRGYIMPWAEGRICACVGKGKTGKLLERLLDIPDTDLEQLGEDGEASVSVPSMYFTRTCREMGARTKRVLSAAHKAKLIEAGKKSRYDSGKDES